MIEMIWIIGMMVMPFLGIMTKDEMAEWFADVTGTSNPQKQLDHFRLEAGKGWPIETTGYGLATIQNLIDSGFGVPVYLMEKREQKCMLIIRAGTAYSKAGEIRFEDIDTLVTSAVWKKIHSGFLHLNTQYDFDALTVHRDEHGITWCRLNPEYVIPAEGKEIANRIESITVKISREKTGHDGSTNTAPYILKNPVKDFTLNLVPE